MRAAATAAVCPGIVLAKRWRSRTVAMLEDLRFLRKRTKNFMTHLHAVGHTERPTLTGRGQLG